MRSKTEEKRQQIVKAAAEVFKELGFPGASMSIIAERVGGSKATLYSYFKSKEELFLAVMTGGIVSAAQGILDEVTGPILGELTSHDDVHDQIGRFGAALLSLALSQDVLGIRRVVYGQAAGADLSRTFWRAGPKMVFTRVAAHLEAAMKKGVLRKIDPWIATMHLKGLLESEYFERLMVGDLDDVTPTMVRDAAKRAVDVFWRAYATEET